MTREQLAEKLASNPALRRLNHHLTCPPRGAEPQPIVCHEPVAAAQREISHSGRISVRVTSFRRRLCDPDNLCPKYFIDCLRYAGLIPDDRPQDIDLQVSQVKTNQNYTEICVIYAQL